MQKNNSLLIIVLLSAAAFWAYKHYAKKNNLPPPPITTQQNVPSSQNQTAQQNSTTNSTDISELTKETVVVPYVKQYRRLPDCYITKREARAQGWNPAQGNLCDVLPGRAIGGDIFTNREGGLPSSSGRKWFEADLNYSCEHRNADRLLFSNDGLVYITKDHYQSFQQQ